MEFKIKNGLKSLTFFGGTFMLHQFIQRFLFQVLAANWHVWNLLGRPKSLFRNAFHIKGWIDPMSPATVR